MPHVEPGYTFLFNSAEVTSWATLDRLQGEILDFTECFLLQWSQRGRCTVVYNCPSFVEENVGASLAEFTHTPNIPF